MNDGGQRQFGPLGKVLVIIPTYNEVENIGPIVDRVRTAVPDAHILVADDNSPDGTGKAADEIAAADDQVHVLHRKGKEGLGAAYLAGFAWVGRTATASSSRWTPTAPTSPRNCPGCSPRSRAPTCPRLPLGARRPCGQLAQEP